MGFRSEKRERNKEIVRLYKEGVPVGVIAKQFDLKATRVIEILEAVKNKYGEPCLTTK